VASEIGFTRHALRSVSNARSAQNQATSSRPVEPTKIASSDNSRMTKRMKTDEVYKTLEADYTG
jgi:hypothetical protein